LIPDPEAEKPGDWDDKAYGEWEPPLVLNPLCQSAPGCGPYEPPMLRNPEYKGRWKPPKIRNPAYKGPFRPRQIQNPDYYEDRHPSNFEPIIGAGFELWMVSKDVAYGNVYIGTDEAAVKKWNKAHFLAKKALQEKAKDQVSPTPGAIRRFGGGPQLSEGLMEFLDAAIKAWKRLFDENRLATVGITLALIIIPIMGCCFLCTRRRAPPPPTRKRVRKAATRKKSEEKAKKRRPRKREYSDDDE
jgi:calnexin